MNNCYTNHQPETALEVLTKSGGTILARRELGESLMAIATDMEMRYETVKTYAKLAREALTQFS